MIYYDYQTHISQIKMNNQETIVDYNPHIILTKVPSSKYPNEQEVFQLKYVPPTPVNFLQQGQVVLKNLYLSIDATMRVWISGVKTYMDPVKPGDIMKGSGVGEVIYSKDPKFKVGDKVLGLTLWQKYSILKAKELTLLPKNYKDYSDFLGVLGISGLTAYFGYKKIGNLKQGQIVVVSAAAGAVGQLAVQLAKNAGCVVIGIASSKQKCDYVKSLGADFVIDYRKDDLMQKMKEYCPQGFDVYFDNVGGQMLDNLLMFIRDQTRIIACGSISTYNDEPGKRYKLKNYSRIVIKRGIIQGFIFTDYAKQFPKAIAQLSKLISEGKLKYKVDLHDGLEQAPRGLKNLLTGKNNGKVIVKVYKDSQVQAKL